MKEHMLLSKAYIYPLPKTEPELTGCTFDYNKGYWVTNEEGTPVVLDKKRPKPTSKKCDVETGEDAKGE